MIDWACDPLMASLHSTADSFVCVLSVYFNKGLSASPLQNAKKKEKKRNETEHNVTK